MNKWWWEVPKLIWHWAWRLSISAFVILSFVNSGIIAISRGDYGMIEGIAAGSCAMFFLFYLTEKHRTNRERAKNRKVEQLIREANSCFQLANQFEKDGKYEASRQFKEDYDNKRAQILSLLGGEVKPEDVR